ncbi:MAG: hypothetical protein GTO60_16465 [Gammaproteobacteria bacterium]|nr:hypothetical protein [Gammaproteobacteria bacterium]
MKLYDDPISNFVFELECQLWAAKNENFIYAPYYDLTVMVSITRQGDTEYLLTDGNETVSTFDFYEAVDMMAYALQ